MTPAVDLLPATLALLDAAIAGDAALGRLLGAEVAEGWACFPEALAPTRAAYADAPGPRPWATLFFLVPAPRTLVGWGGFKGAPDAAGMVEIGYALAPASRGRGLATEAVRRMAARAFAEPAVAVVTAKTLPEASPSTRVLERAGFRRTGCADDPGAGPVWVWSLPRP